MGKLRVMGTSLSPHLFHPTYKYWLDSPTATRVGPPHRSSLAQTYSSSCTSCFGKLAHLLALSAIRCSFFLAAAPLHSNPLKIISNNAEAGIWRPRFPRQLGSAIRIGLRLLRPIHLLAHCASVNGLTFSPLVLYSALSSSHQHRSIQILLIKKLLGGAGFEPAASSV